MSNHKTGFAFKSNEFDRELKIYNERYEPQDCTRLANIMFIIECEFNMLCQDMYITTSTGQRISAAMLNNGYNGRKRMIMAFTPNEEKPEDYDNKEAKKAFKDKARKAKKRFFELLIISSDELKELVHHYEMQQQENLALS